jgi:hypothetical protein
MTSPLLATYILNPDILLRDEENGMLLAVSMNDSDDNFYEFTDLTKECLKMFSLGTPTGDILKKIKEKAVGTTDQESVEFLERFISDLLRLKIINQA